MFCFDAVKKQSLVGRQEEAKTRQQDCVNSVLGIGRVGHGIGVRWGGKMNSQ